MINSSTTGGHKTLKSEKPEKVLFHLPDGTGNDISSSSSLEKV